MRILKPVFFSAMTTAILTSCSSISKIPVPAGNNNSVIIAHKQSPLTEYQKNNWQHLDLAKDSIPGMSVIKAHEFLKNKIGTEIVVGVVDSGTDLKHEDLKDVAWINKNEIANNGIDDDKNGYIDDINGWNFLGKSYTEHLEYERILMNPAIAGKETLDEVKAFQEKKVDEAQRTKATYGNYVFGCLESKKILEEHFGKNDYTADDIKKIKDPSPELKKAVDFASGMFNYFSSLNEAKEYFEKELKKADKTINGDNLKKDYRKVVGDNAYDINDKPGYGDANTGHSEKDEAHGSHVSGIIGATRDNNIGMNGVAKNIKIMAVRTVSDGDEYDKDVALGIRYAVDNGAKVINTSFGKGFSPNKEWVYDAIKYAAKKDVLIVNAAGNDGKNIDIEKTFPNDAPDLKNEISDNFITVGAMSVKYNENLPASFSNYGKINVDVFAPGVEIYSTTPENEYKKFSGTSMAAPNTAGVAALIRSYYPQLTASQVKHILMNSGTKINMKVLKPGSQGPSSSANDLVNFSDLSVSGRIVNAYNALIMADSMLKK